MGNKTGSRMHKNYLGLASHPERKKKLRKLFKGLTG